MKRSQIQCFSTEQSTTQATQWGQGWRTRVFYPLPSCHCSIWSWHVPSCLYMLSFNFGSVWTNLNRGALASKFEIWQALAFKIQFRVLSLVPTPCYLIIFNSGVSWSSLFSDTGSSDHKLTWISKFTLTTGNVIESIFSAYLTRVPLRVLLLWGKVPFKINRGKVPFKINWGKVPFKINPRAR